MKILFVLFSVLFLSCAAPCHKPNRVETLRADFDKNVYPYLLSKEASMENKLFVVRGWWDLQEMKAIVGVNK
jgi:hypothetical protein